MRILAMLFSIVIGTLTLTACGHTAEGLNKDINQNTKEIRKTINDN